jgi:hypothetical protein
LNPELASAVFIQMRVEFERDSSMEWGKWLPGTWKITADSRITGRLFFLYAASTELPQANLVDEIEVMLPVPNDSADSAQVS